MSSSFCSLPFLRAAVESDGRVRPCCFFEADRGDGLPRVSAVAPGTLSEVFHSPAWTEMRRKMRNGERVAGCEQCDVEEAGGKESYRQRSNKEYPLALSADLRAELTQMELYLSSLCNLRCRTCNSDSSSAWREDDAALAPDFERPARAMTSLPFKMGDGEWKNLFRLDLLGGEPMIQEPVRDVLAHLRDIGKLADLRICVNTNATRFPAGDVVDCLKRAGHAHVALSADGLGPEFEYLRKNGRWARFTEVAGRWLSFAVENPGVSLELHPTASAYNMLTLPRLIDWWREFCGAPAEAFVTVGYCFGPPYLNPNVLPRRAKAMIRARWRDWLAARPGDPLERNMLEVLNGLDTPAEADLRDFHRFTDRLDGLRRERFASVFPELAELLG